MNKFEVGKFYAVQVSGWSRKKIPALCIRVTKCTITFQYLCNRLDGGIVKESCRRRKRIIDGVERTYDTEKWSLIVDTSSNELADKPKKWDEVTEVCNG
jgi:hypothetical protein